MNREKKILFFLALLPLLVFGQINVVIPGTGGAPTTLTACGPDGGFNFTVSNASGADMIGDTLILHLPPGTYYTPGSIFNAAEADISDLSNPVFILNTVFNGFSRTIQFRASISCIYDNASSIYAYEVLNNGNSYSDTLFGLNNALNPLLTYSSAITGDGDVIDVFQDGTWGIEIKQTTIGACVDEIYLLVEHTGKLSLQSITAGTVYTDTVGGMVYDTIVINSADLIALGDADGQLCFNETIMYDQIMKLLGCDSSAVDGIEETEARMQVGLNCHGDVCFTNEAFAALNPNLNSASVDEGIIDFVAPGFCKRGYMESYITNTSPAGTPFIDAQIYAGSYNYYISSEVCLDSFEVNGVLLDTVNTVAQSFNYTGFWQTARIRNVVDYDTTDFDGPGGFSDVDGDGFYDDLAPGDTLFSRFTIDYKPENIPECVGFSLYDHIWFSGVSSGVFYKSVCDEDGDFSGNRATVYGDRSLLASDGIDDPNIYDGVERTFTIDISVDVMHLAGCSAPTDSMVAQIVIPPGVVRDLGRPITFDGNVVNVTAQSGDTVWIDISDGANNPYEGALDFPILGDCGSITGLDTTVGGSSCINPSPAVPLGQFDWEIVYYCDPVNCGQSMKLYCGTSDIPWTFHCPLPGPCTGLQTVSFELNRLTLGWSDLTAITPVNPATDTLNLKAAFNRDRVRVTSKGLFIGTDTDSLYFLFKSGTVAGGTLANQTWLPQDGNIIHYDVETGGYDTITILATDYTETYQGSGVHDFTLNLIGDIIAARGTNTLTDQDSVTINMDFIVSDNMGGNYLNIVPDLRGEYYQVKSGLSCVCNAFSATFELGKPTFTNSVYVGSRNDYYECYTHPREIRRGYAYRMLEPHFPNEVRPYFRRDSILVRVPLGVNFGNNGYLQTITRETLNYNIIQTHPIDCTWTAGAFNYAILRDPGTWAQADIGNGTDNARMWFDFDYTVDCRMLSIENFQAYVTYYGDNFAWADSTQIDNNHSFSQFVTAYNNPATITNSVLNPTFEGITDTACWTIQYQNFSTGNGYDVQNNWLLFESPNDDIQIQYLVDQTTMNVLPVQSDTAYPGFYYVELGAINQNSTHRFDVKATYTSCNFTSINVYRENNCNSYPIIPYEHLYSEAGENFNCTAKDTTVLFIDPKDININMSVTAPFTPQALCDSSLITIDIENTGISKGFQLSLDVNLPDGLMVNSGTSEIEFPKNSGIWNPIDNPIDTGSGILIWDISGDTANGISVLGNINESPTNGYRVRFYVTTDCDFPAGTTISFYSNAENACGDTNRILTSTLPYQIVGLSESNGYSLEVESTDLYACGDTSETFSVNIKNLGGGSIPGDTTTGMEIIRLVIDNAIGYDSLGFNGIHNPPTSPPTIIDSIGNTYVEWTMPSGVALSDSMVFEYDVYVRDPDSLACMLSLDYDIEIYFRNDITCSTDPQGFCRKEVLVNSGTDNVTINKGDLILDTASAVMVNVDPVTENVTVDYQVTNTSSVVTLDSTVVEVYHDVNGDALLDIGDTLLTSFVDMTSLNLGDSSSGSFSFNVSTANICNLLVAVSPNKNPCICSPSFMALIVPPRAICVDTLLYVDSINSLIQIDSSYIDGGSFSYCGPIQITLSRDTFDCDDIGITHQIMVIVTDTNGLSDTCTANVDVLDTVPPGPVCQDTTIYLDLLGQATIDTSFVLSSYSENCQVDSVWLSRENFNCLDTGTNQVTVYVTDIYGNIDSCAANVDVVDTIPPAPVCNDTIIYLDINGQATIDTSYVLSSYTENCAVDSIWLSRDSFNCLDTAGSNQVTVYVSDISGNVDSCSANVDVVDTIPPNPVCQDTLVYLDASGIYVIDSSYVLSNYNENCAVDSIWIDRDTFTCADIGSNVVNLYITDVSGNIDSCSANVNVADSIPPAPICNDTVIYLTMGQFVIDTSYVLSSYTENCAVDSIWIDRDTFTCPDLGLNQVTLYITDVSGNIDSCFATVDVRDTTSADIACRDTTLYLNNMGQVTISSIDLATGSFNGCGSATVLLQDTVFTCADVGLNTMTIHITDANNNNDSCISNITVLDTIPPSPICNDTVVYLDVNGQVTIDTSYVLSSYSENCAVDSIWIDREDFTCLDVGVNQVNLYITDVNGNIDSCSANVDVVDTIPPSPICNDTTIYVDNMGQVSIDTSYVLSGYTENCAVDSVWIDREDFTCLDVGVNQVKLYVTDVNGNIDSCSANVDVVDTIPPDPVCNDTVIYLDANGQFTIDTSYILNSYTENCAVDSIWLSNEVFDCTHLGSNNVTLYITDVSGNIDSCTANVDVLDTIPPAPICEDGTFYIEPDGGIIIIDYTVVLDSYVENCVIDSIWIDRDTFDCNDIGVNQVNLYIIDVSGNIDSCSANIQILDTVPPSPVCNDTIIYLDANGQYTIDTSYVLSSYEENCIIDSIWIDRKDFSCEDIGDNQVGLFITDLSGNIDSCFANVNVRDTASPIIWCNDTTLYLNSSGSAYINSLTLVDSTYDACGLATISQLDTTYTCANLGLNYIVSHVSDTNNNADTCTSTITVLDTISPTISCQDTFVYLGPGGVYTIDTSFVFVDYTENCGVSNIWLSQVTFTCTDTGTNQVTIYISDLSGNIDSCIANIDVRDTLPPTPVCMDTAIYLGQNGQFVIDTGYVLGSYAEDCFIDSVWMSQMDFGCGDAGVNQIEVFVMDENGNTGRCVANVDVLDTVPPEIWCSDTTVYLDSLGTVFVSGITLVDSSYDACGVASINSMDMIYACLDTGLNHITSYITDIHGNIDSCISNVTVLDTMPLKISPLTTKYCETDNFIALESWFPGGTWSSSCGSCIDTVTGVFDIQIAGVDTHMVFYEARCNIAEKEIIIYPLPVPDFQTNIGEGCSPLDVQFTYTVDEAAIASYSWSFGNGSSTDYPVSNVYNAPGSYDVTLMVIDTNGCEGSVTKQDYITIFDDPIADFIYSPDITTLLDPMYFFTDQSIVNIVSWEWDFDGLGSSSEQNPSFMFPVDTGTYIVSLIVQDTNACYDTAQHTVIVKADWALYVPNAFTPNADGTNDGFTPKGVGISERDYTFLIFDRWGEIIFESHNLFEPWDGYYKGNLVKNGVYVWKLEFKNLDDEKHNKMGHVTVVR